MIEREKQMYRHELKFLCTPLQMRILENNIKAIMRKDIHVGKKGFYHIRSLYFDDLYDTALRENESGAAYRKKWRIRAYNCDFERLTLEQKIKENEVTQKRACLLSDPTISWIYGSGGGISLSDANDAVLRSFLLERTEKLLRPVVIINYDRIPYIYREGNVRVTFDLNIAVSAQVRRFCDPAVPLQPVLHGGRQLLEVKYDDYLPDAIYRCLNLGELQQTAFSKYYMGRKTIEEIIADDFS